MSDDQNGRAPLLRRAVSEQPDSYNAISQSRLLHKRSGSTSSSTLGDIDIKLRTWRAQLTAKFKSTNRAAVDPEPKAILSVFGTHGRIYHHGDSKTASERRRTSKTAIKKPERVRTQIEFESEIEAVKEAIQEGIQPKMILKGTSGSYFAVAKVSDGIGANDPRRSQSVKTMAVFKPKDEEPYGNLNPKRQFLRTYLWWAMGRPCLIPNFSYLSEAGASYLNDALDLDMVPPTTLVSLSSPAFHYHYNDRLLYHKEGKSLPLKLGSYQRFLHGYINMSDFLQQHPWPSRPRSMLQRDFEEEQRAHKKSRKASKARLRRCYISLKYFCLCRQRLDEDDDEAQLRRAADHLEQGGSLPISQQPAATRGAKEEFQWTPDLQESFRLELEKLVAIDFLMRNTDRGLDNAMVKCVDGGRKMKIGAIDNSLAFPHSHPSGMREYPMGWLWLPLDLIGQPFSEGLRSHLIPILNDPAWWTSTTQGLRNIFQQDPFFDEKLFEKQMALLKGQGWNLLQSLHNPNEGPVELCSRLKKVVRTEASPMAVKELLDEPRDDKSILLLDPELRVRATLGPEPVAAQAIGSGKILAISIERSSSSAQAPLDGANPRSLPETSGHEAFMELSRSARSKPRSQRGGKKRLHIGISSSQGAAMAGEEQDDSALGIDVVEELEGATRRAASRSRIPISFSHAPAEASEPRSIAGVLARSQSEGPQSHTEVDLAASTPALSPPRQRQSMRGWARFSRSSLYEADEEVVTVIEEHLQTDRSRALLKWY